MDLYRQERFGRAHSVGLAGLAAIALVLVVNVETGKLPLGNPVLGSRLPGSQVLAPSTIVSAETSGIDSKALLPREEESKPKVSLMRDQVWEIQAWLKAFDLDPGPIDGIAGPRTFAAVRKFESEHQRPETGNINYHLLGALRLESGLPLR